jgi:hypothetical protein
MELHPQKTRIVQVRYGFEFLGYKSSAGVESFICLRARFVVRPDRMRGMRIPRRSRSGVHGPGAPTNQAGAASADQGADCGAESALAGWGRVLQTRPGPKTFRTSRRLDPAANLVASVARLGQRRLETAARDQVVRRVRACPVTPRLNTFSCILASLSLRESCIHEA